MSVQLQTNLSQLSSNSKVLKSALKEKCKISPDQAAELIKKLPPMDDDVLQSRNFYPLQERVLDWAMYTFVIVIIALASHTLYQSSKS